ncbi:spore coat protein [Paenibacillus sp. GYB003]|uniref:spore coat protein n=1 Tax=Paenibacillus sp. GYB003 TaxID=2994392 RepID=UPI002F965A74
MNTIVEYLTGMNKLTDQVIAMDFLIAAKTGVRNYAMAATEAITPEIKATLTKQLDEAIDTYEQIAAYMIERGWYKPWNAVEQFRMDVQNIETALTLPG